MYSNNSHTQINVPEKPQSIPEYKRDIVNEIQVTLLDIIDIVILKNALMKIKERERNG